MCLHLPEWCHFICTVKILKFRTPEIHPKLKFRTPEIHPKRLTRWLFLGVMHPKDAEGIANSEDPVGAV